jgi:hypothetical protein
MLGVTLGTVFAGCHAEPKSGIERYIPSSESARAGVSRAMEGWLKGLSTDASGSTRPEVHVVDQTRRADQHLAGYEILGEEPAENARAFAVRVTYDGADDLEIVRFLAVGVDPMWIFRQEDYETLWMHQDETPADRAGEPAKKP